MSTTGCDVEVVMVARRGRGPGCRVGVIVAALIVLSRASARAESSAPQAERFASRQAELPPEEPLWPGGTPDVRDIAAPDRVQQRGETYRDRWVDQIQHPTLSWYPLPAGRGLRAAAVICPGGGYRGLAIDKEGHDVARWLNAQGVTGVVLKYRCSEYGEPAPLEDARRALATVRSQATQRGYAADRVGVIGFSAGGHLAASAGTRHGSVRIGGRDIASRPDFMILVYPVISMDEAITHAGSRANLLGPDPDARLVRRASCELQVNSDTPPAFLVHALDDRAVLLEHSLRMFRALERAGVPCELAIYEEGGHGFGLVKRRLRVAEWPARCAAWLRTMYGEPAS